MSLIESHPTLHLQSWRQLAAPPEEVFDALVDPEKHKAWLAPPGDWGHVQSTVDLRVDGVWDSRFSPRPGTEVHDAQTFVVIDPPHHLVTDLVSEATVDGQVMPPLHSRVEFRLEPTVWGTLLTVEQHGFPDVQTRDFFEDVVWHEGFDRLEAFFARK